MALLAFGWWLHPGVCMYVCVYVCLCVWFFVFVHMGGPGGFIEHVLGVRCIHVKFEFQNFCHRLFAVTFQDPSLVLA